MASGNNWLCGLLCASGTIKDVIPVDGGKFGRLYHGLRQSQIGCQAVQYYS